MPFVITVAQRKGGAGKTTLACHLTSAFRARGLSVFGLDLDEQRSYSTWARARQRALPEEQGFAHDAGAGFAAMAGLKHARDFDICLIDTPPNMETNVQRAIRAADLILTPLQLSPLDLAASIPTAKAIGEAGRPFVFVVNRAPPRSRIADDIRAQIRKHRIPCADAELGNRALYAEALAQGLGAAEADPSSAAGAECNALADEVLKRKGSSRRAAA